MVKAFNVVNSESEALEIARNEAPRGSNWYVRQISAEEWVAVLENAEERRIREAREEF